MYTAILVVKKTNSKCNLYTNKNIDYNYLIETNGRYGLKSKNIKKKMVMD